MHKPHTKNFAPTIGDRVTWQREVYRMRYANRPWDTGTVEAVEGATLAVRCDDGRLVRGPRFAFLPTE